MRIRVSRHVYGSVSGYQTLASSSEVTSAEIKELETLSFGQTTDHSYLESLKEHPAYLCRQMSSSGKWAITRIFKGANDDYGRVTLLFITVLISKSDWLEVIHSDVKLLLSHKKLWAWDKENVIPEVSIGVSHEDQKPNSQTIRNALSLLSVLEASTKEQRRAIVINESIFTHEDIRWLNMILPLNEKEKFSCAVSVLNDSLPFTLICMSKSGSSVKKGSGIIHWKKNVLVDNTPYTHHLLKLWTPELPSPWNLIRSCKSFHPEILSSPGATTDGAKISTGSSSAEISHQYEVKTARVWKRIAVATLIFVFLCAIITLATHKILAHREISGLLNRVQLFLNKYPDDKFLQLNLEQSQSAILKARILLHEADVLGGTASDNKIIKSHATLSEWINVAEKVVYTLKNFDNLVVRYNNLNLSRRPQHYPSPESINKVNTTIEEFEGYVKPPPILGEKDIARAKRSFERLEKWLSDVGSAINHFRQKVEHIRSIVPLTDPIDVYSERKGWIYENATLEIEMSRKNDNFTNAVASPIDVDRNKAKALWDTLDSIRDTCKSRKKQLKIHKKNAESACSSGKCLVKRSNDLNFVDGKDKQIELLKRANDKFDIARKNWPTMDGIDQDIETTSSQIGKLISQIDKEISALTATDSPNGDSNYNQYIEVQKVVDSCTNYDATDTKIKDLEMGLSAWAEKNRGWLKLWDFIHKCRDHPKISIEELEADWSSINKLKTNQSYPKLYDLATSEMKTVNDKSSE